MNAQRADAGQSPGGAGAIAAPVAAPAQWRHLLVFECVGAGAFGSVHRAWDPKLDRDVAVKLLPGTTATGLPPLDEARNLARVRHPNVVTIHGADEHSEQAAIWMEFVDGETLAAIVRQRGPMSPREVTGVGLDLCSALSAIHGAGLLHRDIKAQNVMREVGGRIVLMDFSGAHMLRTAQPPGTLSGTPLYMAPELFENGQATTASDVYSLGVLLFFLLSAHLPVDGASSDDVRRAHNDGRRKRLRDLRSDVPDSLARVLEPATAADPRLRYQTAGELAHALSAASGVAAPMTPAPAAANTSRSAWIAGAVLAAVAVGVMAVVSVRDAADKPSVVAAHFTIGPPFVAGSWPRLSPDGESVVYGATVEGRNRFWVHRLDKLEGRALMETTANETPFFSPDSQTLAYFTDNKLFTIPLEGGHPQAIAAASAPRGGDWHGRTILFAAQGGLFSVDPSGTALRQVTRVDQAQGDFQHGWPRLLPDGRRFLYVVRSTRADRSGIYVGSLDGEAPRRLLPDYSRATIAAGHLLYVKEGTLTAHPFDAETATLSGEPHAVASRIKYHAGSDAAFDVSSNGVLIYDVTAGQPTTRLVLYDIRGREVRMLTDVGFHGRPRFSPDGERIAAETIATGETNPDIWIYGVHQPAAARLTQGPASDLGPVWSPDGQQIAYSSKREGLYQVFVKAVNSAEPERPLVVSPGDKLIEDWSPDGRHLLGTVVRSGLWTMPLTEKPKQLRASDRTEPWQAEFSPDGRWLAYMSGESGAAQVYVEPFPATGARWQVSANGGAEPHWRRDGRGLLYLDPQGILTTVSLPANGGRPSVPQPLFRVSVPDICGEGDYSLSPDGRFIVVNTFVADPMVPPIDVVVNWTQTLQKPR